jgi:hypothetical protein
MPAACSESQKKILTFVSIRFLKDEKLTMHKRHFNKVCTELICALIGVKVILYLLKSMDFSLRKSQFLDISSI